MAARWDRGSSEGGGKDYINCPMTKEQYEAFVTALNAGEKTELKDWEKDTPYFEGCMPIEVMASRGVETLRFGPMKGVGLVEICITSGGDLVEGPVPEGAFTLPDVAGVGVVPAPAKGEKCARCWQVLEEVGK